MDKEFLSQNITHLRKERGWSQEKLAQEAEVSYHTVFRAEAGTKPRMENLQKIARALGVTETELISGKNLKAPTSFKAELLTTLYTLAPQLQESDLKFLVENAQSRLKK